MGRHCGLDNVQGAEEVLHSMKQLSDTVDEACYAAMIRSYGRQRNLLRCKQLYEQAVTVPNPYLLTQ
jgi:pentatricopeptide repeat protein